MEVPTNHADNDRGVVVANDELDELFAPTRGGKVGWYDQVPDEVQRFMQEVADRIIAKGREPNSAAVRDLIEQKWPEWAPRTTVPIRRCLRDLVKQRAT